MSRLRDILDPIRSLDKAMDVVEKEIYDQTGDLRSVESWASTLDFKNFKPRIWGPDLRAAQKRYKELGKQVGPLRQRFERLYAAHEGDEDITGNEYVKLAHMALEYGAVALQTSEARLGVFFKVGKAFLDAKSVNGHMDAAKNMVRCAEKALNRAQTCYEEVYGIELRSTGSPSMFSE